MSTLFTRIITGDIPARFVMRENLWVAFLDIRPVNPGHVLLVPRQSVMFLHELDTATLTACGPALARISRAVRQVTECPAVNVVVNDGPEAGQEVPHAHIHVIPRFANDGKGLHFTHGPLPAYDVDALAQRISASIDALAD